MRNVYFVIYKIQYMKSLFLKTFLILLLVAGITGCRAHRPVAAGHPRHLPPGHAKKIYGHRSARAFAPGQQKKVVKKVVVVQPKAKKKGKKH